MRALHLVVEKFAEVLHVDAAFAGVNHRHKAGDNHLGVLNLLDGPHHVGELADARGLDEDAVRMELLLHLHKGLAEIAHQRAADATRVHLGNLDAGVLKESAVDADLAELVLNENNLFSSVAVGKELFDERRFTRAQES